MADPRDGSQRCAICNAPRRAHDDPGWMRPNHEFESLGESRAPVPPPKKPAPPVRDLMAELKRSLEVAADPSLQTPEEP